MARFANFETSFWDDEDIQDLTPAEKLIYIWTFTNPNCRPSGIYKISIKTVMFHTGLPKKIFEGAWKGLKDRGKPLIYYDSDNKIIWVIGKFKQILAGFKGNKNMISSVKHDIEEFRNSFVSSLFIKKYEGALEGLISLHIPIPIPLKSLKEGIKEDYKEEKEEGIKEGEKIFKEIIDFFNKEFSSTFSYKTKSTQKLINGRLAEGRTIEDFKKVITNRRKKWMADPKMEEYLRPKTLFNATNFENYLNEALKEEKKTNEIKEREQQEKERERKDEQERIEEERKTIEENITRWNKMSLKELQNEEAKYLRFTSNPPAQLEKIIKEKTDKVIDRDRERLGLSDPPIEENSQVEMRTYIKSQGFVL